MVKIGTGQQTLYDMNDIVSGTTAPSNPYDGQLWLNKNDYNVYTWNGSKWVLASPEYQISGRNLLRDSGRTITNNTYPTTTYNLTQALQENETVTVSLKGTLGAGKVNFSLYNSGGSVTVATLTPSDRGTDGIFRKTFNWKIGGSTNNTLHIYPMASTTVVNSTIEWIVLERGTNKRSDWIPAPEDDSTKIEEITATLGNMANDNILDFKERQLIKDKLIDILGYALADSAVTLPVFTSLDSVSTGRGSFYTIRQSALNAGILPTDGIYSAVGTQYTNLKTYLEGLTPIKPWDCTLANNTKVVSVVKATFVDRFLQYYKAEKELASYTSQKLRENADNIKVGGTNLLPDTAFKVLNITATGNHTAFIDTANKFGTSNSLRIVATGAGSTSANISWTPDNIIANEEYEVSFYAKSSVALTLHTELNGGLNATNFNVTTTWQYFSHTLKGSTVAKFYLWLNASGTVYISRLQLEKGNRATDWSPNPNDVDVPSVVSKFTMDTTSMNLLSQNINLTGRVTFASLGTDLKPMIVDGESAIINSNYNFIDWATGSTLPTGYSGLTGAVPTKVTSDNGTGVAVRFSTTAGADNYFNTAIVSNRPYTQYVYVEATFKLESGTLGGSGVMLRYLNSSGAILNNFDINLATEVPSPINNKWYTVSKVFKTTASTNSSFASYQAFVMASYSGFNSTRPAKVIQFDSVKARPATQSEITSYEMNTVSTTAGGVTYIDGGKIKTDNINTLSATVGTLTGGRLYGAEIEGASIYTSNTPSFWDANFTERLSLNSGYFLLEGQGLMNNTLKTTINGYGITIDGVTAIGASPNKKQRVEINTSGIDVGSASYPTSNNLSTTTFGINASEVYLGNPIMGADGKLFMGSWYSAQLFYEGYNTLQHSPRVGNSTALYIASPNGLVLNDTSSGGGQFLVSKDAGNNVRYFMRNLKQTSSSGLYNMLIDSSGNISRLSSASKYKILIEDDIDDYEKILDLNPRKWYDKRHAEELAFFTDRLNKGEEIDERDSTQYLTKGYGFTAEDVESVGLDKFCQYDYKEDGTKELEGVAYDRMWIYLIPIVKKQKMQIQKQDEKIAVLESLINNQE